PGNTGPIMGVRMTNSGSAYTDQNIGRTNFRNRNVRIFQRLSRLNQSDSSHLLSLPLVTCHSSLFLADQRVQLLRIETGIAIVFSGQLKSRESVFVGGERSVRWLI